MHNHFFEYYIKNILPELKKIEQERLRIKKRIYFIIVICFIILLIPVTYLFYHTNNIFVVKFLTFAFIPALFLFKKRINVFSDKYKRSIIKKFLEQYFPQVEIYTLERFDTTILAESKLINLNELDYSFNSDYRVTLHDSHFQFCEIIFYLKTDRTVVYKGVFCIGKFNIDFEDELFFLDADFYRNQKYLFKEEYIPQPFNPEDKYIIYSKNEITNEKKINTLKSILTEFHDGISLHFNKDIIYCLITFKGLTYDKNFELFEPDIISDFNSQETYKNILKEYYRITIISKLLKLIDSINNS